MEVLSSVTLIIPTIPERTGFLAEALASVAAQVGGPEISVMVLPDTERRGPAHIRNLGVSLATTEWVAFLDDDDVLLPEYFQTLEPHMADNDVVYGWCIEEGFSAGINRTFDPIVLRGGNFIPVTTLVRREMIDRVGGFPQGVAYEDWALWLKIVDAGGRFKCVETPLWRYRRHDGSRTYTNQALVASGKIQQV